MTATKPHIEKRIINENFEISLFSSGIIEINWNENIKEITSELLQDIKAIIFTFGGGKKMPVYIHTINFLQINPEGRKYAASKAGQEFTLANAVLIDNLGKKIMFNFFMKFNRPSTPTKAFGTRTEAIEWLQSLQKQA